MILALHEWGDPILRAVTEPVGAINFGIQKIVDNMIETMYAIGAAGLAANQVGVPLSIMLVDRSNTVEAPIVAINPKITLYSKELVEGGEGCFSLPGIYGLVWRPARITLEALNQNGELCIWTLNETHWHSIAAQHEFDHLQGIFFTDLAHIIWEDPLSQTATYKNPR